MADKHHEKSSKPEPKKADEQPKVTTQPETDAKDDAGVQRKGRTMTTEETQRDWEAHERMRNRLRRAIKPLEEAADAAHDQALAGHAIASSVTEAVVNAAHEMVLAAKAMLA